jgi:hypothetical protein
MKPRRALCSLLSLAAALTLSALAIAAADQATGAGFRVTFTGSVSPRSLPRDVPAPIALRLHARIRPLAGRRPPRLRRFRIEVNRHAQLDTHGLPGCPIAALRSLTTAAALHRCPASLLGAGSFSAHIDIPEQAPFPSHGKLLLFYSRYRGHPALLGHVFGSQPTRTSEVLPILISDRALDGFGTTFSVRMPEVGQGWGYVTGIDLEINRRYRYQGRLHSFLRASCPVPQGFSRAPFVLARGTYFLAGGRVVHRLLTSTCTASRS